MKPGLAPEAHTNTDLKQDTWELFILQIFFISLQLQEQYFNTPGENGNAGQGEQPDPLSSEALPANWDTGACLRLSDYWSDLHELWVAEDLVLQVDTGLHVFKTLLEA